MYICVCVLYVYMCVLCILCILFLVEYMPVAQTELTS